MQTLVFAFLALSLSGAHCALAPFIKPCKGNDNPCVKQSAIAAVPHFSPGIPELGVPSTDPLIIKEINADQGDLKLSFIDLKVEDLSKCRMENVIKDHKNSIFTLKLLCPVHGVGHYKMDGKVFVIPAQGDGKFEIKSDEVLFEITAKYKTITSKDGTEHWKIISYDYKYDLVKKVYFNFENLFGGDETKAQPVKEIFDKSWKEIITQLGGPIVKAIVNEVVGNVKKFFLAVPVSELELS